VDEDSRLLAFEALQSAWPCKNLGSAIYFEDEPCRRSAAKLLSKDEAQRISVNIVKVQNLLTLPR
jgi:hypothetical protein